jgi:hypothetical protein
MGQIGQLGGNQRSLFQADDGQWVRSGLSVAGGSLIDGGVGIDLSPPAELKKGPSLMPTVWADVPRRKNLQFTVRALLPDQ